MFDRKLILFLLIGVMLQACGSNKDGQPEVGQGAGFSSLSTTLSPAGLLSSLFAGTPHVPLEGLESKPSPRRSRSVLSAIVVNIAENNSIACPNGGTKKLEGKLDNFEVNNNFVFQNGLFETKVSYKDCGVTVAYEGQSFQQVINGTGSNRVQSSGGVASGQARINLSVSGDLGFSVECEAAISGTIVLNDEDSQVWNGRCTLRDQEEGVVGLTGRISASTINNAF